MLQTTVQDLIARMDLFLPWLLPSLETLEMLVPASGRLLICVPLVAWLAVIRRRQTAEFRRFARVVV